MGWFHGKDEYHENFMYSLTPSYFWDKNGNALTLAIQRYLKGQTTLTDIAKSGVASPSLKTKTMVKYMFTPEYLRSVNKTSVGNDDINNPDNLKRAEQYSESFIGPLPKGYSNVFYYRAKNIKESRAFIEAATNKYKNQFINFSRNHPEAIVSFSLKKITWRDLPEHFTSFYGKDITIKLSLTSTPHINTNTGMAEYYDVKYYGNIVIDGDMSFYDKTYDHIAPEEYDELIDSLGPSGYQLVPEVNTVTNIPHYSLDKEALKYSLNVTPTVTSNNILQTTLEHEYLNLAKIIFYVDELDQLYANLDTEPESDINTWKGNISNTPIIPTLPLQGLYFKSDFSEENKKIYIKACNKGFGRKSWDTVYKQNTEVTNDFSHDIDIYFGHIQLGFYHNDILVPELANYAFEFAKRLLMNAIVVGKPATVTEKVLVSPPSASSGAVYKEVTRIAQSYTEIKSWYGAFQGYPDLYEVIAYASAEYTVLFYANFPKEYAAFEELYFYGTEEESLNCIWYVHRLSDTQIEVIKVYGLNSYMSSLYSFNLKSYTSPTHYAQLGRTFTEKSFYTELANDGMYLPYIPDIVQKLPNKAENFCMTKCVVSVHLAYIVVIEHVKWYNTGLGGFVLTVVKIVIMVVACITQQWYVAAAVVVAGVISILEQYGLRSGLLSKIKLAASIFAVVFSAGSAIENVWNSASSSTSTMSNVSTTATASNSVGTFANEANFAGSFNLSGINTANGFQYTNIAGSTIGTSSSMSLMDMVRLGNEIIKPFQKGYELYSEHKQRSVMKTIQGIYDDMSEMNREYALKINEITYNLHNMDVTQEKNKLYVKYLKTCFRSPYHFDECMYTGLDIDIMYDNTIRTELDNKYEIENSLLFA